MNWADVFMEKLLDLVVTIIAFAATGGVFYWIIERRRHTQEQAKWKRDEEERLRKEQKLEIDVSSAVINAHVFRINDDMADDEKVDIYQNKAENKVRWYAIAVDFVIRNTTDEDLIVSKYGVEDGTPPMVKTIRLYDMETADCIDPDELTPVTLKPSGIIARSGLIYRQMTPSRSIDKPPDIVRVYAFTSGKMVEAEKKLQNVSAILVAWHPGSGMHLLKCYERMTDEQKEKLTPFIVEEAEIPF